MLDHLGGFLAISVLLIVAPGPDMALVARNALRGGRRSAIATAGGVFAGLVVWTGAASIGLAALLRASEPAFVTLGFLFCVLTLAWLSVYSILVARAGDFLRRSGIRRALDGLTGVVLSGLGFKLALERRS